VTRWGGAVVAFAVVVGGACSRGSDVGPDDAVEILVLDGLDRDEASCLVAEIDDRLDLREVTGLGGDLDSEELTTLFEASRSCQTAAPSASAGVVGGSGGGLERLIEAVDEESLDVEGVVAELLRGGLHPDVAVCVATTLLSSADPVVAVSDEARKIDAIVACEDG
jgi:hypothetical protein